MVIYGVEGLWRGVCFGCGEGVEGLCGGDCYPRFDGFLKELEMLEDRWLTGGEFLAVCFDDLTWGHLSSGRMLEEPPADGILGASKACKF
jgi:hypothetical protein